MVTGELHRARFAKLHELFWLLSNSFQPQSVLLGMKRLFFIWQLPISVRPTRKRREIGNTLIVGPTRSGKGLLAVSQLLTWNHSVIVNDIKGELFQQTAGYRSTLGPVYVLDPTGVGHRYDPLSGKQTEDALYSAATHLLFQAEERDQIFTQRAIGMLAAMFAAAKIENVSCLPFARLLLRAGLAGCVEKINSLSPELATLFLDTRYQDANLTDRFLLSSWGTLTARMRPLLTETVIRSLSKSDFTPESMITGNKPVTVYLRWKEQDLLALSPLVRLLWGSLIDELVATYDKRNGTGCKPVLLLIDEAGRTAIPSLAEHATTIVGRGMYIWLAVQSLSQLEVVYGKERAQVLRDNMESQVYYRPTDLQTAKYLEERCGRQSGYAHTEHERQSGDTSTGLSEQAIPLLTAQDFLQFRDHHIIGFHRNLPPFRLHRMDWRKHDLLKKRRSLPVPILSVLSPLLEWQEAPQSSISDGYIDPDGISSRVLT
jgi:type IV secretory pathway TraG/TraD family ATPase VirD4